MIDKPTMTQRILAAKAGRRATWASLAAASGLSPVFVASAALGSNTMPPEAAARFCAALGLDADVADALGVFPHKTWERAVPTDPLIYRLYEIVGVYGESLRQVIQEEFGDGIMSAIDFSCDVERVPDPKGDRVKLTLNGKFLPYRVF